MGKNSVNGSKIVYNENVTEQKSNFNRSINQSTNQKPISQLTKSNRRIGHLLALLNSRHLCKSTSSSRPVV